MDPLLGDPNWAWKQSTRASKVCKKYLKQREAKFTMPDKFSVIMNVMHSDRLPYLERFLGHYLSSPLVDKVFVVWQVDAGIPKKLGDSNLDATRVHFLPQEYWSVNNHFNPINNLTTTAVLMCDDQVWLPMVDIEFAYRVWQRRPNTLVGFWPRVHYPSPEDDNTYVFEEPTSGEFTILLTKTLFMRSQNLFIYTCLLPSRIHRYVDYGGNCEDIAINFLNGGLTGEVPVAVVSSTKMLDFSDSQGTSRINARHTDRYSTCVTDMLAMGNGKNFLAYSKEVVHRYDMDHTNFKTVDITNFPSENSIPELQ